MPTGPAAERFDCIMPAAGESLRMGSWKLLLPFRDATVVEWSVRNALVVCSRVILVAGYRGEELAARFARWQGVEVVANESWQRGMFSSIKRGAAYVESERFFVALSDMPAIEPKIFRELTGRSGCDVARPTYRGRPGHPVLLSRSLIAKILALDDSRSMAEVLRGARLAELPVEDRLVTFDLDTPADYQELANLK